MASGVEPSGNLDQHVLVDEASDRDSEHTMNDSTTTRTRNGQRELCTPPVSLSEADTGCFNGFLLNVHTIFTDTAYADPGKAVLRAGVSKASPGRNRGQIQ